MAKALKKLLKNIFPANQEWKIQLMSNWNSILGDLGNKVRIEKILDDTIVCGVQSSCWMQELYMLSSVLIKTINKNLDKPRIKQLRFKKAGTNTEKKTVVKKQRRRPLPTHIDLTVKQKKALAHIEDVELRTSLEKFLIRCQGENR